MKIYVAGHRGLVGSAIVREIEANSKHSWIGARRDELDLLDRKRVFEYLQKEQPDAVVIAAAKVGGISANFNSPVEFLTENLQIETNLIDGCHAANIKHVLFLGSSCIYPKYAPQPIKEEYLLTGELEQTNAPYALAKIAGLKLVEAYRNEYSHKWISLMPTNMYGPGDNFDTNSSHVLPALIRKFHDAKKQNADAVTLWGSGTPLREFLHADDLAKACLFTLENYNGDVALNVGSGSELTIRNLAEMVSKIVGFRGTILWDASKPDGTPRKLLDSSKLRSLGWSPTIELREGIASTYKWYLQHCKD